MELQANYDEIHTLDGFFHKCLSRSFNPSEEELDTIVTQVADDFFGRDLSEQVMLANAEMERFAQHWTAWQKMDFESRNFYSIESDNNLLMAKWATLVNGLQWQAFDNGQIDLLKLATPEDKLPHAPLAIWKLTLSSVTQPEETVTKKLELMDQLYDSMTTATGNLWFTTSAWTKAAPHKPETIGPELVAVLKYQHQQFRSLPLLRSLHSASEVEESSDTEESSSSSDSGARTPTGTSSSQQTEEQERVIIESDESSSDYDDDDDLAAIHISCSAECWVMELSLIGLSIATLIIYSQRARLFGSTRVAG